MPSGDVLVAAQPAMCSKEEMRVYRRWFAFVDSDGDGRITGPDAVPFFKRSGLMQHELKAIWAAADDRRQGYLGMEEFVVAMRLIAKQQLLSRGEDMPARQPCFPALRGLDEELASESILACIASIESDTHEEPDPSLAASLMSLFKPKAKKPLPQGAITSVVDGLRGLYESKLRPLEEAYCFHDFHSPALTGSDFEAKPMVMLLGQYSTGKTTFIRHLLSRPYPGSHIGPEPTTDRFVVVMNGPDERSIPGNTVAVSADMPFAGLTRFGSAFLEKLEVAQLPHPLLDHICLVDTPGVLAGEKQRTQRSYDFTGVTEWFASKCDLILLLFDPHKLDVSDEFKRVITSLHGNKDKIRLVLNKADQVNTQQLMRVYGALMWSLGKVINTPEVMRVYIGSFSDTAPGKKKLPAKKLPGKKKLPAQKPRKQALQLRSATQQTTIGCESTASEETKETAVAPNKEKGETGNKEAEREAEARNECAPVGEEGANGAGLQKGNGESGEEVGEKSKEEGKEECGNAAEGCRGSELEESKGKENVAPRSHGEGKAARRGTGKSVQARDQIEDEEEEVEEEEEEEEDAEGRLGRALFEREMSDLLSDLGDLPRKSCDRKINEFVKRARAARVNAFIISHLRAQLPLFGRAKAQQRLIENLPQEFEKVAREHRLAEGDLPPVALFQRALAGCAFESFERLNVKLVEEFSNAHSAFFHCTRPYLPHHLKPCVARRVEELDPARLKLNISLRAVRRRHGSLALRHRARRRWPARPARRNPRGGAGHSGGGQERLDVPAEQLEAQPARARRRCAR
ncbi:unnamed protein product, partial [Closterium sp. NIES-65]